MSSDKNTSFYHHTPRMFHQKINQKPSSKPTTASSLQRELHCASLLQSHATIRGPHSKMVDLYLANLRSTPREKQNRIRFLYFFFCSQTIPFLCPDYLGYLPDRPKTSSQSPPRGLQRGGMIQSLPSPGGLTR